MIQRLANKTVLEYLDFFSATSLVGPRQVGKTTLARQIEREWKQSQKNVIFLDMENANDAFALQEPMMFLESLHESLVIIDEVQRVPEIFPVLRVLIDRWRVPGRFLLLGSAAPTLQNASSESLAGRIGQCELSGFGLLELQRDKDIHHPSSAEDTVPVMFQHLLRGSFPPSFLASSDKRSLLWRKEFIRTYSERDLPLLGLQADPKLTRTLLTMLAHYHGQIWNAQTFAASLGISAPTVNRYVRFLEDSFLVTQVQPFATNTKKRLVKSPKIYVRDSGLVTALLGINSWEQAGMHPQLGALWEGYVIEQVRSSLNDGQELWFYRTHEGAECDCVITEYGEPRYALEIKYSSAPKVSKGFRNVIADLGTKENILLVPQGLRYPAGEGIIVQPLSDFLTQFSA